MQIAIVGSTGRTGKELVARALEAGHDVVALTRDPARMDLEHPRLRVVQADVLTPETLPPALDGCDAVLLSLGGLHREDASTRSVGTGHVLDAMKSAGVPRIGIVSTVGVGDSINQLSEGGQHVVRTVIHVAVADHGRQEERVRASGLSWTIARPGGLGSGPLVEYEADPHGTLRIGGIPRACVADFLVRALEDPETIGHTYALTARAPQAP